MSLHQLRVNMGCDPELFIAKNNQIIGSEKVIPKDGISTGKGIIHGYDTALSNTESKIIIDGIQVEINPRPNICRANLGNDIAQCFKVLKARLEADNSLKACFSTEIEVSSEEFDTLSEEAKRFGCAPSQNVHTASESKITVDPKVYRKRSAGGHIHLGHFCDSTKKAIDDVSNIVQIMDYIVGNTCVLIDRDSGNIERRKVYGKAGEYRKPGSGRIEYRTLSNFWLTSYQLMSFVMGLSRFSVCIVVNNKQNEFYKQVPIENIINAINNNDFDLAMDNFRKLAPVICDHVQKEYENDFFPLSKINMPYFYEFTEKVRVYGLRFWFPEDPMVHWTTMPEGHGHGWESFLTNSVKKYPEIEIMMEKMNSLYLC